MEKPTLSNLPMISVCKRYRHLAYFLCLTLDFVSSTILFNSYINILFIQFIQNPYLSAPIQIYQNLSFETIPL